MYVTEVCGSFWILLPLHLSPYLTPCAKITQRHSKHLASIVKRSWNSIHLWVKVSHWLPRGKPVVLGTHSNSHHSSVTDCLYLRNQETPEETPDEAYSGVSFC